jgi:hypothetical protein
MVLIFASTFVASAGQATTDDREAVRLAALDYLEGLYNADPDRIRRSVHPSLVKRGFSKQAGSAAYAESPMSFDQLIKVAETWNRDKKRDLSIKEVKVLDVLDQTAVAQVRAAWGVDHLLLAKYGNRWQIVQILWQSRPPMS